MMDKQSTVEQIKDLPKLSGEYWITFHHFSDGIWRVVLEPPNVWAESKDPALAIWEVIKKGVNR